MCEDVLGVQRDAAQVSVLLDEVEQLGGVGHPEGERSCDVLLLLWRTNHTHKERKQTQRVLLEQQDEGEPGELKEGREGFCLSGSQKEQLLLQG